MRTSHIFLTCLLCLAVTAGAQRREVRKGNELYEQKKYAEAAAAYQNALKKDPQFAPGAFNLGNALIQQKQYEAARKLMNGAANTARDPHVQSSARYNTGNTYLSEQQWQQAIEAYKDALRKNPQDADARYNLSYALAKLKREQQQQKDNRKNRDKQEGQKKEDDKKDDNKENGQQKDSKQDERKQPQPGRLTEQQADNLLQALQQEERRVHQKMQQGKGSPVRLEKDW